MFTVIQIDRMNEIKAFGQLVKEMRIKRGMEAKELADLIGVSTTKMSNIENGYVKTPPEPSVVRQVSGVLGIPITEMLITLGYLDQEENAPGENRAISALRPMLESEEFTDEEIRALTTHFRSVVDLIKGKY